MKKIINVDFLELIDSNYIKKIVADSTIVIDESEEEEIYFKSLIYYIIVTYSRELEKIIDKNILYINRYYWFRKFYYEYYKVKGFDAGIEQQIGMLLEDMANNISDTFDWSIIEEIHKKFEI